MHGKDMNIPKGTEITAYINGNVQLDRTKFDTQTQASQSQIRPPRNPVHEVEVDGSFMGNTPSQLSLVAGDHTIKLSKSGFKPWERRLKVSGGTVSLNAELEQLSTQ